VCKARAFRIHSKNFSRSREIALEAEKRLASLQQTWGEQLFRAYLDRKDIQRQTKLRGKLYIAPSSTDLKGAKPDAKQ
jgi:hypothetical protein